MRQAEERKLKRASSPQLLESNAMKEQIVQFSSMLWRRIAFLRSGVGLAIIAVAFVGFRLLAIQLQHPAHFKEITAAYGADSMFYGTPQISHSGSQFTFVKNSANGDGLFLCDTATGHLQMLFETNRLERQHDPHDIPDINALSWAPDDSAFLYSISGRLVIHAVDTSQPQAELIIETNFSNLAWHNPISEVVWLNSEEFAYIAYGTNLCYAQKQDDGSWKQHDVLSRDSQMSSLTAIGDDAVAWLEDNLICHANLTEGSTNINLVAVSNDVTGIIMPPTNGLALWLDASKLRQMDQSLVTRLADLSRNKNDALWNGHPPVLNGTNSPRSLNGKSTIHFTSLNSSTNGSGLKTRASLGIVGAAPRSVFVVMRHDFRHSMMVGMGNTVAKGSFFGIEWTNYLYLPTGWRADVRIRATSTNWNVLEVVYDGFSQKGYVNGILRGRATNRLDTADKEIEIGLRTATAGKNAKAADGDFAELLIYDRALNFIERKQVEDYLSGKWFGKKRKNSPLQNPCVWFIPPVDGLTSFSYSKESGQFLLNCTEGKYRSLWRYEPLTADLLYVADGGSFHDEQWSGDDGYAYFHGDSKQNGIVLRSSPDAEENRVLESAKIRWFKTVPDETRLLFLGTVTNEPSASIWQYDLVSKKLLAVVPYSDYPSDYAKDIIPVHKTIKLPSGTNLVCDIFEPANVNPHKKYPLVIGDTEFYVAVNGVHGRQWVPCVAAGGAYVVIIDRKGWFNGIENWGDNVMTVCGSLREDLPVDSTRVFLFGSSSEVQYMWELMTNTPGLWKGIIILNTWALPDPSYPRPFQQQPRILISNGGEIEEKYIEQFQQKALKSGLIVEYLIHQGEGHHVVGNAAQLERTRSIMRFVFEE